MAHEIERKFLTITNDWREGAETVRIVQGYLSREPARTVRVRIRGVDAFLTIKGITTGITRAEFEYPIPLTDAEALLKLCLPPLLEKHRHHVTHAGRVWEIDEFAGTNEGLVVAEIELTDTDEIFDIPPWIGAEVSHLPRYYNSNLAAHPYSEWSDEERREH